MLRDVILVLAISALIVLLRSGPAYCSEAWKLFTVEEMNESYLSDRDNEYTIEFLPDHSGAKGTHESVLKYTSSSAVVTWNVPPEVVTPGSPVLIRVQLECQGPAQEISDCSESKFIVFAGLHDHRGKWIRTVPIQEHTHGLPIDEDTRKTGENWTTQWSPPDDPGNLELWVTYVAKTPGGSGKILFRYRYQEIPDNKGQ